MLSNKEFKDKIDENIILLEDFKGTGKKIKVQCTICQNIWEPIAGNLLQGSGCKECFFNSLQMSNEEFLRKLNDRYGEDYSPLETCTGSNKNIKIRCNRCNYEWEPNVHDLLTNPLRKEGCPNCLERKWKSEKKTTAKFQDDLDRLHGDGIYTVLSEYTNNSTKVLVKHNSCGHIWHITPTQILGGISQLMPKYKDCPNCKK